MENNPYGTFVLAKGTHPSFLNISTKTQSVVSGFLEAKAVIPQVETNPFTFKCSLTVIGTPNNGERVDLSAVSNF